MKISPVSPEFAKKIIEDAQHVVPAERFDFAIAAENDGKIVGVIGMYADGKTCSLGHLWTNGESLVGSVLYGAAWRVCKGLGYDIVLL